MKQRWTVWDISLLVMLVVSMGLLLFPFGIHGVNYLRVKNGMKWDVADAIFNNRIYSGYYNYRNDIKYKHYTLSGPIFMLIKVTGKFVGKNLNYKCAVVVGYDKQIVVSKRYIPFDD